MYVSLLIYKMEMLWISQMWFALLSKKSAVKLLHELNLFIETSSIINYAICII